MNISTPTLVALLSTCPKELLKGPVNPSSLRDSFIPTDLREWLDHRDLIDLILEAVQTLYWTNSEGDGNGSESADSFSLLALGLLAYCYATDFYSTVNITQRLSADCDLHFLCRNQR